MSKFNCFVCVEEIKEELKVSCQCEFEACRDCCKQYLLSQTKQAHCMSCKTGWGAKFMIENFTKSWVEGNKKGQYREHRKSVALDREKSRLPESLAKLPQIKAEQEAKRVISDLLIRRRILKKTVEKFRGVKGLAQITPKTYKKEISDLPAGISKVRAKELLGYSRVKIPEGVYIKVTNAKQKVFIPGDCHSHWIKNGIYIGPPKQKEIIDWLAKKAGTPKRTKNDLLELKNARSEIRNINVLLKDARNNEHLKIGKTEKVPNFICPCPVEECRGMIDSKKFKCVKCEKKICKRCREPKVENHKCDKNVLENVKFLRQDTKPCPNCATPIHKISGCLQMWCTSCRTAFNWRTGQIETGTIHNPHAIEWQRQHGNLARDVNDIPCGGLVQMWRIKNVTQQQHRQIEKIHRVVAEIDGMIQRPYNDFEDIRLKYVLDKITEEKWKQSIFLRERANERKRAKSDILTAFRTFSVERFRNLAELNENTANEDSVNNFFQEMEALRGLLNKAFKEEMPFLGTSKPLQIKDTWKWSK